MSYPDSPEREDRFTWPTSLCPHPEYWTSTDGDSTEVEVSEMVGGLVRGLQPDLCLETGTAWGQTTQAIGIALAANGHGRLVSLETDEERIEPAQTRCVGLPVEVILADSLVWVADGTFDFMFFDSLYEYRVPEFLRFREHMRVGTIVAFHDSAPEHGAHRIPSGKDLRTEIADTLSSSLRFLHLPTPRGITLGEVI